MRTDPKTVDGRTFDVLVIGGGIQGAAIAREAAVRGSSVLLAEKTDFGWGTSSKSSRLIHGGLRYLEHGHLSLVREALAERERLLRSAPHLVRPLPMLMPFFKGSGKRPWMVKLGLKLYGLLAGRKNSLPAARSHGPDDCRRLFPPLRARDLRGGALFYDARTEDQRLTLAVVEAARVAGAVVANHLAVSGPSSTLGSGIELRDGSTGDTIRVEAKHVFNAAGPQVDAVRRILGVEGEDLVRRSRGCHVVLDPLSTEVALAAFLPDRRIQFVIPHADGTLCGTTEVEEGPSSDEQLAVPAADVDYLLAALGYLYETPPSRDDLRYAYGGWRALPTGKGPAGQLNREAFVHVERGRLSTVRTIVGGKLTTHRSFAERTINALLGLTSPSPSRTASLPGGDGPQEFADPLWWRHGSRASKVRRLAASRPDLLDPICPHRDLLRAEAVFALRYQATMTFTDLMRRRLCHSQGPCLNDGCLDDCHRLYAEFAPDGVSPDRKTDKSALLDEVHHSLGALLPPVTNTGS